jgi:hypothetical protein
MFEQLRASFRAMLDAARSPDDRRAVLADMKNSVVRARMGSTTSSRGSSWRAVGWRRGARSWRRSAAGAPWRPTSATRRR